ncbi:hypothetical protein [Aeromonas veronii]|uniref:hypothetical protein n=1 Tax=Aeromonas veronii TaxID=654 RepID=UPI002B460C16|nr:hypothetical protein [Aeromonas veronii]
MKTLLYLITIFSLSSHAAVYVSSVSLAPAAGGVSFTPTARWLSTDTSIASGDLYAQGYRYFGIGTHVTGRRDGGYYPANDQNFTMFQNSAVPLKPGDTWTSAAQRFIDQYGASGAMVGTYSVINTYNYEGCAAVSKFSAQPVTGSGGIIYPGSCATIEFSNNVCSIDASGLIDHGNMTVGEVDGHVAKTYATISCLSPAGVIVRVLNAKALLGNGVESQLFIDGRRGDDSGIITFPIGYPKVFELTSELSSLAPQPGLLSGASIIVIEVV